MPANLENLAVATGLGFHSSPKEAMPKNVQTNKQLCSFHIKKIMLKILQTRFQQNMNHELPDVQAGFGKGRGTRHQIANILWITEKAREFQKNIYFCFSDFAKAFIWITTNCGTFLKRWEYKTTWPASWEICMLDEKQQLEPDVEQQTGSKLGKKYIKAVYCHPAYLTSMQSTSWETLGWRKHNCNQDCQEEYQ